MAKKKIFKYTSDESENIIESALNQVKKDKGIMNAYLIEKWVLEGISRDCSSPHKDKALRIINERYK